VNPLGLGGGEPAPSLACRRICGKQPKGATPNRNTKPSRLLPTQRGPSVGSRVGNLGGELMHELTFRAGDRLWLGGHPVTLCEYHRYGPHRVGAALVRRNNETAARVVPVSKLAHDRSDSLACANGMPAC